MLDQMAHAGNNCLQMDPQQRLLMEVFAEALTTSNSSSAIRASSTSASGVPSVDDFGVYVGISSMDYQKLAARYTAGVTVYSATGVSLSVAAGRLSYSFGLRGPALSIDTACSSSLVAAHTASLTLRAGSIRSAAAAGTNLTLSPDTPAMFTRAGMLSPEGRCKTLDAAADGYVRAEAVGVMVLEALSKCHWRLEDQWSKAPGCAGRICCNQDGRSSSLTAPNGPAQQAVMRAALVDGQLEPDSIAGLSLHGTGTPLGGSTECLIVVPECAPTLICLHIDGPNIHTAAQCLQHRSVMHGGMVSKPHGLVIFEVLVHFDADQVTLSRCQQHDVLIGAVLSHPQHHSRREELRSCWLRASPS